MDDKVTLLPCPFCGASAIFIEYDHGDYSPKDPDYMVRCEGEGMHQLDHIGNKDELARIWNRRQAQEAPKAASVRVPPCQTGTPCPDHFENGGKCGYPEDECEIFKKAASVPYDGDPSTCECDYHKACRGEKAASQSAEDYLDAGALYEKLRIISEAGHRRFGIEVIEADRAAQRSLGAEDMASVYGDNLDRLEKCYAEVVEAARGISKEWAILPSEMKYDLLSVKTWLIRYMGVQIKALNKALADLDAEKE